MSLGRRCAGAILVALALVVAVASFSRTANAATAYRYWTYYVSPPNAAAWSYSQRGPASEHPQDGEVQGWRFAIQADRSGGLTPRVAPDFAKLCASQPATAGKVRVGVVLDFGVADDAPAGEHPPANVVTGCVLVADGASGVDVLDAAVGAANVRIGQGLICGISGYPKSECADVVAAPKPTAAKSASPKAPAPAKITATATPTPAATVPADQPAASAPAPTTTATLESTVALSSSAVPPSTAASESVDTLSDLKKPSNKTFPTAAVIGVVLVLGLAVAAIVRGLGARR